MALDPGLYVAATPIGNLADVTFRVVEALKEADLILCEDTRRTAKLCAAYGIETPRAPYHEHNAARVLPGVLEKLKAGARVCLVSDAGTPLISDPGYRLARAARDAGVKVVPLPGPCAAIAALSVAGAPTDRFVFAGFPPAKAAARRRFFEELAPIDATLVFYESPSRLAESLAVMAEVFGDRPAAVARELTKLHEEVCEGRLAALAARYAAAPPKGEIALVVHPPALVERCDESVDLDALLGEALARMSLKDAVAAAAAASGRARKEVYARALALKGVRR